MTTFLNTSFSQLFVTSIPNSENVFSPSSKILPASSRTARFTPNAPLLANSWSKTNVVLKVAGDRYKLNFKRKVVYTAYDFTRISKFSYWRFWYYSSNSIFVSHQEYFNSFLIKSFHKRKSLNYVTKRIIWKIRKTKEN